jgi:hypothetical protein
MAEIISLNQVKERRSENRKSINRFYCVEIDFGRPIIDKLGKVDNKSKNSNSL